MMKKIFTLFAAGLMLAACGKGDEPREAVVDLLPLSASIDGAVQNRCPGLEVVLSAFVQNAESVEWRKDGVLIEGQNSRTLTVSESGSYTATGVNEFGSGIESAPQNVAIFGCETVIAGNDTNRCPDETIMLVASCHGASVFEWRKDGVVIEGKTSGTLTIHEGGSYTAAAVIDGVPHDVSDPKVVTVDECLFVDVIVGDWQVEGKKIYFNDLVDNRHIVTIEKVDDETINIYNFTGEPIPEQVVVASVDNEARTIFIDYQPIITTDAISGYTTYLSAVIDKAPPANVDIPLGTIPVEGYGSGDMRFVFPSTVSMTYSDGEEYHFTWYTLSFSAPPEEGGVLFGSAQVGFETVWTKR